MSILAWDLGPVAGSSVSFLKIFTLLSCFYSEVVPLSN